MPFKEPAEKTPSPSQHLTTTTKLLQQPAVITGCSKLDFLPYFSSFSVSVCHRCLMGSGSTAICPWLVFERCHFTITLIVSMVMGAHWGPR